MESDGHARSTCGVRELRQPPVRRSVRQRAAAARRPTSIVCWWQSGDAGGAEDRRRAPAPACAGDDGPPRSSVRPTRHSPPHGDIRVVPGWWPLTALGFARAPNRSWRLAALNDQQKMPRVNPLAPNPRARARGARRWRRELGGGVRQHPGSNNCVEGAYGIARFAEREAVESDGHARSTCGVRELRQPPVRRSVRQRAAAARRPTSIVCWWQSGDAGGAEDRRRAPAPACAGDDGPPRSSVRPTRHSPPHGDIRVVPGWWPLTALGFARAPNRSWRLAALNDQQKMPRVNPLAPNPRARARGARRWRRELGGGVRQHPGSNNCVEGAYGIARFAEREAVESDGHARSTCGVRELRQPPVRRSVRQRAAAARRPTSIVCWWQSGDAGGRYWSWIHVFSLSSS